MGKETDRMLGFFPLATRYRAPAVSKAVREQGAGWYAQPPHERHLQCVWFDNALRPQHLFTHEGESVTVEDPGAWNLEAGPDFRGAAAFIGSARRRIAGDVEVHIHPAGWRQHGHAADPRYARVRFHITFHPGPFDSALFPPGAVQIALRAPLAARAGFSFDQVDITTYPYANRAPVPPCLTELRSWPAPAKLQLLEAAGQERLRRKAERLHLLSAGSNLTQAAYEETFAALGFKLNKQPFRQVAQAVPLELLRAECAGAILPAFALLAGVAGLLPEAPGADWDNESRQFFRQIWDAWWKRRERFLPLALPRAAWQLGGLRPANHPLRRLMAAAALFAPASGGPGEWIDRARAQPAGFARNWTRRLTTLSGPYFDHRAVFGGKRSRSPQALIGPERADALLVNVAVPLLAQAGVPEPFAQGLLDALPAEKDNAILRQAALNLFGADCPPSHLRSGVRRQGLLQIFHDYCLNDRSRCAACPFPNLLRRHRETPG